MRKFIIFLGLISLILDLYVYQGFKKITADWKSERARKIARWGFWIFFAGFSLLFMYVVYLRFSTDKSNVFMQWVMNLFITFFVTKLVFILVLVSEDIVRLLIGISRLFTISG